MELTTITIDANGVTATFRYKRTKDFFDLSKRPDLPFDVSEFIKRFDRVLFTSYGYGIANKGMMWYEVDIKNRRIMRNISAGELKDVLANEFVTPFDTHVISDHLRLYNKLKIDLAGRSG